MSVFEWVSFASEDDAEPYLTIHPDTDEIIEPQRPESQAGPSPDTDHYVAATAFD